MNHPSHLHGAAAFAALIEQWRGGPSPNAHLDEPPFARLSAALVSSVASERDLWALLRHALRYESLRRGGDVHVDVTSPPGDYIAELGLQFHQVNEGHWEVAALPWKPNWLEDGQMAVDEVAMRSDSRRFRHADGPAAEPFLRALNRSTYRSLAQQTAIRAAVSMPPAASLVIDLPTGEGKSTVFQVLATCGFAASPAGRPPGTVVVVVPTVALALDHERSCGGTDEKPMAYLGGRDARNRTIVDRIKAGDQRIVFAAPEAIVKTLRPVLHVAAREGRLGAVVVDEAHLIDGWGTGFRTEFQTLAGALNAWRQDSPAEQAFRTIFLSATYDDSSLQALQELFCPGSPIPIVSGARVRPEPEYWVAAPSDLGTRAARVQEALDHLPRPTILYVTRVADAQYWFARLHARGYSRLALVHGGTSADDREQTLRDWNAGEIDVVVATSAFGLGIDYPHVRTVIHACLPETFSRFYQEVGRGGRDGCASVSLLVPHLDDSTVARSLSAKKTITVRRGIQRWRAMFSHPAKICEGHPVYRVPLDIPVGYDERDIDLVGERSTDWAQRTLALMARSGLIQLLGATDTESTNAVGPVQFERVKIVEERHLDEETWQRRVEPTRQAMLEQGARAFKLLTRFATGRECPAQLIAETFSGSGRSVALVCSGCRKCRADPMARVPEGTVPLQGVPWPLQGTLAPALDAIWGALRYAIISYPGSAPKPRTRRDFLEALKRLDAFGVRQWVQVGHVPEWLSEDAWKVMEGKPWVTPSTDTWAAVLWPKGAKLIVCGPGSVPRLDVLSARALQWPRLIFVPEETPDPSQPQRLLMDVVAAPVYSFQSFLDTVLQ